MGPPGERRKERGLLKVGNCKVDWRRSWKEGSFEICEDCFSSGGDLGCAGNHAAVFYVQFNWAEGSTGDHASGILLWIRGVRARMADCVPGDCDGSGAVSADDDSVDGGEVRIRPDDRDSCDAGADESEGFGVGGDGYDFGDIVCGGVDQDKAKGVISNP